MKKRKALSLPTIPFVYLMVLLSGCAIVLQPLPDTIQEQMEMQ